MQFRKGFTLIELLVVIAILAVLAVVVVLTLNPAGLLQEARDSTRLSDLATLNSAIAVFSADTVTSNVLGQASTLYVSVPDPMATSTVGDQCQGLGLPALSSGAYHCAASSTYRKTDGTGWIPINFSLASFGTPLSRLPVDPVNVTSSAQYYKYMTNGISWELVASPESQKYQAPSSSSQFITGSNITLIGVAAYSHYRSITVTASTTLASGTLASFPMLVSSTLVAFEPSSTNASGRIQNLCTAPNGSQEPCDLIFSATAPTAITSGGWNCGTSLNYEAEQYTSSTGALIDWVQVPSLSAGTVLYVCYGSSAIVADQSRPSSTWDTNYLGVWHLPNGATLTANDSTVNGKNGTLNGAPAAGSGQINGGASFNGTNGKDIATSVVLPTTNFTYSMWGNSSAGNLNNVPAGAADSSAGLNGSGLLWGWPGTNQIYVVIRQGSNTGTGDIEASPSGSALNTGWHYITVVMSSVSGGLVYCDGILVGSNSAYKSITTGGLTFTMGQSPNQGTGAFTGLLDEVRVSNVVRSPSWISTEYNNESSPSSFYSLGSEQ